MGQSGLGRRRSRFLRTRVRTDFRVSVFEEVLLEGRKRLKLMFRHLEEKAFRSAVIVPAVKERPIRSLDSDRVKARTGTAAVFKKSTKRVPGLEADLHDARVFSARAENHGRFVEKSICPPIQNEAMPGDRKHHHRGHRKDCNRSPLHFDMKAYPPLQPTKVCKSCFLLSTCNVIYNRSNTSSGSHWNARPSNHGSVLIP